MMKYVLALASLTWLVTAFLLVFGHLNVPDSRMIFAIVCFNAATVAAHLAKDSD
jgi:hypothetical protein